jgi:hypothetical protein
VYSNILKDSYPTQQFMLCSQYLISRAWNGARSRDFDLELDQSARSLFKRHQLLIMTSIIGEYMSKTATRADVLYPIQRQGKSAF